MAKRSKRYQKAAALVEEGKSYSLEDAVGLIKQFPGAKFDETVSVSVKLGVDPRKSDQMVRGTCPLPHGSGQDVRVIVFAQGEAATAAEKAGADRVGFSELIEEVKGGFMDFDAVVATPDAMSEVRKLGRQLGPRGLMPNPKTGTVTEDTAGAVTAVKAGRVDFKLDKNGNIAVTVGKASFSPEQLIENTNAAIGAVEAAKPATAKGRYLEAITLSASMSPGVTLSTSAYNAE
jgi:large subunit ribosomal protein L1